jgi:hypothetical protein
MSMADSSDPSVRFADHRLVWSEVPQAPERIGYAALADRVGWRQRERVKRAVNTLVGLQVLMWAGTRKGRAVCRGPRTLDDVLAEGVMPAPDRELAIYPLLMASLDSMITEWHLRRGDTIDDRWDQDGDDGVTAYNTSSMRIGSGAHTRPDITIVVDLSLRSMQRWADVHAVEVKPYWSIDRSALFEAAAQAALRRCSFSWLVVWIPHEDHSHFSAKQRDQLAKAQALMSSGSDTPGLPQEAAELGLGLALARDLSDDSELRVLVDPVRRVMEPRLVDELLVALGRSGTE